MVMKNLTYTVEDGIATIVWDMPGRPVNVLSEATLTEFSECIDKAIADDQVKGILITSNKPGMFIAGADLSMLASANSDTAGDSNSAGASGSASQSGTSHSKEQRAQQLFDNNLHFNMQLRKLETCGKPAASAINGTALGGGLEVALASHYRVVADDPKIQIGLPECTVGVMPGGGGTQRLPRLIGVMQALPLILQGKRLAPQAAQSMGIVHKVVPADQLLAEARRWLQEEGDAVQPWDKSGYRIPGGGPYSKSGAPVFMGASAMLQQQTYGNYPAQKAALQSVYEGLQVPLEAALRIESRHFTSLLLHPTARNMIRSLFLSMQELEKGARRPAGIEASDCKKLGVLGAGMMGAGVAYVSALAGIEVVLIDRDVEAAQHGKQYAAKILEKRVQRGRTTTAKMIEVLERIQPSVDYGDLEGCDLIIEAVFEDRKIKADVTQKAEAVIPESAIFGSNTSTLPITGLAEASSRPESFIGIHFFSPVDKMKLVEIILGKDTGERALAVAMDYTRKIRKVPIVVNDSRGFYTSRCFGTYVQEGMALLAEGVAPALIENAGKATGMPVAPLAMADEVSLELAYHIQQQTRKDLGDQWQDTPASRMLEKLVADLDRKGRKNRKGFYDYPEDGEKRLWPGLSDLVKEAEEQPSVELIKQRLLYIQALETARCFEQQVVTDVRDADVGAILGWGFAPWSGGPLSMIDTIGVAEFVAECDQLAATFGSRFEPNPLLREMAEKGETFYGRFAPGAQGENRAA
jgi:3-hydroxyacyl-CoA dehydrogenase/enoyl-CoA hydratase/3-hydroxybutyryl-CoA epimerase